MAKPTYEGYSTGKHSNSLRENFGSANVYGRNARSLLTKASGYISAYDFTLNPYQGCQYGCSYCYAAAFSPNEKMRQDWGNWVIVKQNSVELLEKELAKWCEKNPAKPPSIYMSSVTDPYQPIESKERLTRRLLEVMVEYRPTLVIQTRSPMIVRDIDILQRFKHLRVNMSIPTGSEAVRKDFEPRSPSITARLNAVKKIKESIDPWKGYPPKISITITPLLPTLPDDEAAFFSKLAVADRIVIQEFHASSQRSLVATTRPEALAFKQKYDSWYKNERESYQNFKEKLYTRLQGVQIMEGKEGFGYD